MAEFRFLSSSIERQLKTIGKTSKMKDVMDSLQRVNKNDDTKCESRHWQDFKKCFEKFGFTAVYDRNMAILTTALFAAIARSKCNKIYDWAKIVINRVAKPKSYNSEKPDTQKLIPLGQALLEGDGNAAYEILHCSPFMSILKELGVRDKYINNYLNRMKKITPWRKEDSKQMLAIIESAFAGMTHVEYHVPRGNKDKVGPESVTDASINRLFRSIVQQFSTDLLKRLKKECKEVLHSMVYTDMAVDQVDLAVTLMKPDDTKLDDAKKHIGRYEGFTVYVDVDPKATAPVRAPGSPRFANVRDKYVVRFDPQELREHCRACLAVDTKGEWDAVAATYSTLIYETVKDLVNPGDEGSSDNTVLDVNKCDYVFDLLKEKMDRLKKSREQRFEPLRRTVITYKIFPMAQNVSPDGDKKISATDDIYVKQLTKPTRSKQRFEVQVTDAYLIGEYDKVANSTNRDKLRDVLESRANEWVNGVMSVIYSCLGAEAGYQETEEKWRYVFDLFKGELDRLKKDREDRQKSSGKPLVFKSITINCEAFPHFDKKSRGSDKPSGNVVVPNIIYLKQLTKPNKKEQKFEVQLVKSCLVDEYNKAVVNDPNDGNKLVGDVRRQAYVWAMEVLNAVWGRLSLESFESVDIAFERELRYSLRSVRGSLYEVGNVISQDSISDDGTHWGIIYVPQGFGSGVLLKVDEVKSSKDNSEYRYYSVHFNPILAKQWLGIGVRKVGGFVSADDANSKMVSWCVNEVKKVIKKHEADIAAGTPFGGTSELPGDPGGEMPSWASGFGGESNEEQHVEPDTLPKKLTINDLLKLLEKKYDDDQGQYQDHPVKFSSLPDGGARKDLRGFSEGSRNVWVKMLDDKSYEVFVAENTLRGWLDTNGELDDSSDSDVRDYADYIAQIVDKLIQTDMAFEAVKTKYDEDPVEGWKVDFSILWEDGDAAGAVEIELGPPNKPIYLRKKGASDYDVWLDYSDLLAVVEGVDTNAREVGIYVSSVRGAINYYKESLEDAGSTHDAEDEGSAGGDGSVVSGDSKSGDSDDKQTDGPSSAADDGLITSALDSIDGEYEYDYHVENCTVRFFSLKDKSEAVGAQMFTDQDGREIYIASGGKSSYYVWVGASKLHDFAKKGGKYADEEVKAYAALANKSIKGLPEKTKKDTKEEAAYVEEEEKPKANPTEETVAVVEGEKPKTEKDAEEELTDVADAESHAHVDEEEKPKANPTEETVAVVEGEKPKKEKDDEEEPTDVADAEAHAHVDEKEGPKEKKHRKKHREKDTKDVDEEGTPKGKKHHKKHRKEHREKDTEKGPTVFGEEEKSGKEKHHKEHHKKHAKGEPTGAGEGEKLDKAVTLSKAEDNVANILLRIREEGKNFEGIVVPNFEPTSVAIKLAELKMLLDEQFKSSELANPGSREAKYKENFRIYLRDLESRVAKQKGKGMMSDSPDYDLAVVLETICKPINARERDKDYLDIVNSKYCRVFLSQ